MNDDEYTLQYISDLHLEMRDLTSIPLIKPIRDKKICLALCGDIGNPFLPTYKAFLNKHYELYDYILIVAGNHEYYNTKSRENTMKDTNNEIKNIMTNYDNVIFLNMNKVIIGRTKFIGCTFWSDISKIESIAENAMNDYKNIYVDFISTNDNTLYKTLIKSKDILVLHNQMKTWIKSEIDKYNSNTERKYDDIIILTHHAPSFKMLNKSDLYSPCYATDCDDLMGPPIKYWISGHTHVSKEVNINETRCLSNCMGYPFQNKTGYDISKHITFK